MMQYLQLRLKLFRFLDISELSCLTLVLGSLFLLKCVWIHRCWEPETAKAAKNKNKQKKRKKKETQT